MKAGRQHSPHHVAHPEFRLNLRNSHRRYPGKFRLQPGELMLFDNSRVLHGRTSYNPNEGLRHLQGCYIDRDGPLERYSEVSKRTVQKLAKV